VAQAQQAVLDHLMDGEQAEAGLQVQAQILSKLAVQVALRLQVGVRVEGHKPVHLVDSVAVAAHTAILVAEVEVAVTAVEVGLVKPQTPPTVAVAVAMVSVL
jgi:hypothetical protein